MTGTLNRGVGRVDQHPVWLGHCIDGTALYGRYPIGRNAA
jgi:hypothetical protein